MGVSDLQGVADNQAFIAFGRKNDTDYSAEVAIGEIGATSNLSLTTVLNTRAVAGQMTSTPVGPATAWHNINWQYEGDVADKATIDLYGITPDGSATLVYSTEEMATDIDISFLDATQYPFVQLLATKKDSTDFTAPQLQHWRTSFNRYPEVALDVQAHYSFIADTLQEGQEVQLEIGVTNVEESAMDSLSVHFTIIDKDNVPHLMEVPKQAPLAGGETIVVSEAFNTEGFLGDNILVIELNPNNEQPEKFRFNNILYLPFVVTADQLNPVVDVTFDGRHIIDGDLVSAEPEIILTVRDENPYLALNDTTDFYVAISYPGAIEETPIYFNNPMLTFIPATSTDAAAGSNKASIRLNPTFTEDGKYELSMIARDRSHNFFAVDRYTTHFEVITESSISHLFNYPNPFTTSTQFVFTLTGKEVPEYLKIQIMTISGKVVREIRQDELGPLHIGHNRTEFAWDGTDEFGNKLANGVYLYRVSSLLNGASIKKYNTDADAFFNQYAIGKMYLLR
jgi:hypothetical protein